MQQDTRTENLLLKCKSNTDILMKSSLKWKSIFREGGNTMPKTKKEITELKRALNTIKKCNGDCKYCNKFHIYIKDCGRSI